MSTRRSDQQSDAPGGGRSYRSPPGTARSSRSPLPASGAAVGRHYAPRVLVQSVLKRVAGLAPGDRGEPGRGPIRGAVAASMVGKAAEMVALVLLATVVPRVLGPEDFGRFSVPLTVVTIGALAMTLGGPTVMARYVPAADADRRIAVARAVGARLARGRALQLAAIATGAVGLVALDPERFPPALTAAVVVALALNVVAGLALQVALGLGRTGPWSTRWPLQNAVLVVAVLSLQAAIGDGGAVAAILIASSVGAAFGLVVLWPIATEPTEPAAVPPGAIRFGTYHATGAALTQFAQRGGVLAVALLGGSATETAYAALAIGIALGATYAVLQAFTVSLPHLSDAATDVAAERTSRSAGLRGRDPERVLRRLAGALLVLIAPGALVAVALLDPVVPAVFGADFAGAVPAFGPALAAVVLAPLNALVVQAAALRMRPGVAVASGCAAAAAFVVVALVAVPSHGAVGATGAALAGGAASAMVAARMLPGAVGGRVGAASTGGVVAVLALAAWT